LLKFKNEGIAESFPSSALYTSLIQVLCFFTPLEFGIGRSLLFLRRIPQSVAFSMNITLPTQAPFSSMVLEIRQVILALRPQLVPLQGGLVQLKRPQTVQEINGVCSVLSITETSREGPKIKLATCASPQPVDHSKAATPVAGGNPVYHSP